MSDSRFPPADRIPLEIWSNIFLECLPSHDQPYVWPSLSFAPLLLCQVNRAWRSTALSLTCLWSSISIEVSRNSDTEEMAEGIGTWLGRSGTRPLAISLLIDQDCWEGLGVNRDLDPILDRLISFIGRWEIVRLELCGPFSGSMSNIHLLRAPLLKRCEVYFLWVGNVVEQFSSMLSSCPHLTEFV